MVQSSYRVRCIVKLLQIHILEMIQLYIARLYTLNKIKVSDIYSLQS